MSHANRFDRLALLLGEEGLKCLQEASVAVFGLGGVGSYAVEALVRGGIGRLTLIDFDQVDITNSNRQIHAQQDTIGQPKALVMAERCRAINPDVEVEPLQAFYSQENSAELLDRGYDYVLDCIDHITAKIHLIETCVKPCSCRLSPPWEQPTSLIRPASASPTWPRPTNAVWRGFSVGSCVGAISLVASRRFTPPRNSGP